MKTGGEYIYFRCVDSYQRNRADGNIFEDTYGCVQIQNLLFQLLYTIRPFSIEAAVPMTTK